MSTSPPQSNLDAFLAEVESIVDDRDLELAREENKDKQRKACGETWVSITTQSGEFKIVPWLCRDIRNCDNCRKVKWDKEIEPRLIYAQNHMELGTRLKHAKKHNNDKEAFQKSVNRSGGQFYAIALPDDMNIIIHNAPDREGEDLYDIEYEGEDINFKEAITNMPEKRRTSGSLGKKRIEEQEDEDKDYDKYEAIKMPMLCAPSSNKRDLSIAHTKAVSNTQNINVENHKDLERAMLSRQMEMKKLLPEDAFIFYAFRSFGTMQVTEWNSNKNNGVIVQTSAIDVSNSRINTDKLKLTNLGNFMKEAGMFSELTYEEAYMPA